ncbi:MAG: DUF11 domain-containing protein [Lysobacteraceae bacterium]|nr:MAG: DUF11 domain-containing protein [Xanthomonadaceae bacterium]
MRISSRIFRGWHLFCKGLASLCIAVILLIPVSPTARAQAGCTAGACISAGPRLVQVDSTQGPVLNLLFSTLLPGTTVNASVLDWNALAQTDINLNALITQLGLNLGLSDTSQVLASNITLAQLQLAMVQVLQADGNTAAANALNLLPLNVPGLSGIIRLADLLQVTLPPGSLALVELDVLDLVTGSAQLYNFRNVLTTPTPVTVDTAALGLPGIANLQLWLQVVEPPVYVCGTQGASFHTGAIRIKLNLDVAQGLDLQAVTNALNALGLGLANVALTADVLKLQLYADIARAEGTLTAVDGLAGTVSFNARPGLANLYVGTVADSVFFNRTTVITSAIVTPVDINNLDLRFNVSLLGIGLVAVRVPLTVAARAAATGTPSLQSFTVSGPFPQTRTSSSGTVSAGTLITTLLNSLDIEVTSGAPTVTLLGIPIGLPAALVPILNTVVNTVETVLGTTATVVLQPVFNVVLGGLVDNVLGLLGIRVGNAVFTVEGIARSCAALLTLSKVLQPVDDPGLFNLTVSQGGAVVGSASNVGNGGATTPVVTTPGATYDLAEAAGTGTTLARYVSTWSCTDQDGTQVSAGSGTSFSLPAPALAPDPVTITCRITNRTRQADVSVTKSDGSGTYTPGSNAIYTITVSNAGPDPVAGATIDDALPPGATLSSPWTCAATSGSCSAASGGAAGQQSISATVDLAAGGQATITVPVVFSADPAAY